MDRRDFVKLCAASTALAAAHPSTFAGVEGQPRFYERVKLVDLHGRPIEAKQLAANRNYLFHYPYAGTPCFLLDLGKPLRRPVALKTEDSRTYDWEGGVGPSRSIVSYSAICAHKLAYPTKQISFISYRGSDVPKDSKSRPNVIHCCAEHSEYDPAVGARVVSGPAKQPLAAIMLEYEPQQDELYAVGTIGGEMFAEFFRKYEFRLAMEHGPDKAKRPVGGTTVVSELLQFCQQEVQC